MKEELKTVILNFLQYDFENYDSEATIDSIDLDQLAETLVDGLYDNFGDLFSQAEDSYDDE